MLFSPRILAAVLGFGLFATGCQPQPVPVSTDVPTVTTVPTSTSEPTQTPIPSPTPLPERIHDAHGVEMILIPAGDFTMGSDEGFPDEKPVHIVYVDAFYIDKLEVTNAQYKECVDAGACRPPRRVDCCSNLPLVVWPSYYDNPEYDNYPVTWLDWYDGDDFCAWRGARLATEAEWEKAARGTDDRTYPWGDDPPTPEHLSFTWLPGEFPGKAPVGPSPVGSFPKGASPYGVLDMVGNVYEWIEDRYEPDYYSVSPAENPTGPAEGKWRIARGGSFFNQAFRNRVSNRNNAFLPADLAHFDAGARCAADVP
jgi:formylglycine-generating enzyme required for sulfatase activity